MPTRSRLLLVASLVAATALYALFWTPYGIDDAWITYRYAEQLAAGNGFVYNVGERVLGTSTPLYALILAAAASINLPVPLTGHAIAYLCMLATLIGVYLLTREIHSDVAGLLAVVFVVLMQEFHRVATYGMETPLYFALIVFAFYAYARGAMLVASALAGLCLVARLDGAAVGAALFLTYLLQHRRLPWAAAAVFLAVTLPWFLFSQLYFGSVLPNSYLAKRHHPGTGVVAGWLIKWLLLQPYAFPAAAGALVALRSPRWFAALPLIAWSAIYVAAYTLSGLWRYEWYLTPMTAPLGILAAVATVALAAVLSEPRARVRVLAGAAAVLLVVDVVTLAAQVRKGRYENALERDRYDASLWMRANLPRDTTIATGGIGMPGYFTRAYILDTAGLVSPQLVGKPGADFFMEAAITRYRPPYSFHSRMVVHDMKDDYVVLKIWPTGEPIGQYLLACRKPCPQDATSD